ncbi:MAG: hypothetical protein ACYS8W_20425, partial [Planctomycetota bacterium]
ISPNSNFRRDEKYVPEDSGAYRAYVSALTERYDGDGENDMPGLKFKIERWQVGNELDLHGFFRPGFGKPTEYMQVLKLSHGAIKSADPEAIIVLSPLCGATQTDEKPVSRRYLSRLAAMDVAKYVDEISFHFYPASYRIAELAAYYEMITETLGKELPFSVTEMCVSSVTKDTATFSRYAGANERTQAGFIARIHAWLCARPVRHICWNSFRDLVPFRMRGASEKHFNRWAWGSFTEYETGNKKLSYFTYKLLSDKLGGVDTSKTEILSEETGGVHAYRYHVGGKRICILWNEYFDDKPAEVKPEKPRERNACEKSPFGISGLLWIPFGAARRMGYSEEEAFAKIAREQLHLAEQTGAGWVRVRDNEFPGGVGMGRIWYEWQYFDFTDTDELIRLAQSRNLSLLFTLAPPPGMNLGGLASQNIGKWESYVKAVVERYDGDGEKDMPDLKYGVRHWKMGFIIKPDEDAKRQNIHLELLRSGCMAVKSADKNAFVHLEPAAPQALKIIVEKGAEQYFDIINLRIVSARKNLAALEDIFFEVREICPVKPIWIGDCEFPAPLPERDKNAPHFTQKDQAAWLVRASVSALSLGIDRVFWSRVRDEIGKNNTITSGLWNKDFSPKPSALAAAKLFSLVEGCDLRKIADVSGEDELNFVYTFRDPEMKIKFIAGWREDFEKGSPAEIALEVPDGEYEIVTAVTSDGNFETKSATASDGKLRLTLGPVPVYAVPKK